ncbi:MAG: GGDEF domain-containing protein [Trueperaceae bacterium]
MGLFNWSNRIGLGNVLVERDFQVFLARELHRLSRRPRVFNVACIDLLGLDELEPALAHSVLKHILRHLASELRKREVLAHTTPYQLALCFPDSSPDEAHQSLSTMQLEVQGSMQLYDLNVSMNIALYSFDKATTLPQLNTAVDALLNEARDLGKNIILHEIAVKPTDFGVPFTVQRSQFDKLVSRKGVRVS